MIIYKKKNCVGSSVTNETINRINLSYNIQIGSLIFFLESVSTKQDPYVEQTAHVFCTHASVQVLTEHLVSWKVCASVGSIFADSTEFFVVLQDKKNAGSEEGR
jgi:hypothetical protein